MASSEPIERPAATVADPAPLGLAAFALTTFVLSAHNAGRAPDVVWMAPGWGLAPAAVRASSEP